MDFSVTTQAPTRYSGLQGANLRGEPPAGPQGAVQAASAPASADGVTQAQALNDVSSRQSPQTPGQLTEEEQRQVEELKARDREVRAHEQAHKTVGGRYAGAISYDYQRGPDGRDYAVGGSVPIDVSPENDPEDTIAKMRVVIKAALAPAEPSAADRAVAAAAQRQLFNAQADLSIERAAERRAKEEDESGRVSAVIAIYAQAKEESGSSLQITA
ncbi:MAG: putative metalloprotease CJM1_0395 family protein [Pseudomonadota bacterium]